MLINFFKSQVHKFVYKFFMNDSINLELKFIGLRDQWKIYPKSLNKDSLVISGGVGKTITFEEELIKQFNLLVYLFDPSITGAKFMSLKKKSMKLIYSKIGLANFDGFKKFGKPDNPSEGSFRLTNHKEDNMVNLECTKISTFMKIKKIKKIDILKIDIEGFEYEVIDDIINSNLEIDQICLEFHYKGLINIDYTVIDMYKYFYKLKKSGYLMVWKKNTDFTFLHERLLRN